MSFRGRLFHGRLAGLKGRSAHRAARKPWALVSGLTAVFVPSAKSLSCFWGLAFLFFQKSDHGPDVSDGSSLTSTLMPWILSHGSTVLA